MSSPPKNGDPSLFALELSGAHTPRLMKHRAARREYLSAIAEFERACVDFSEGMRGILQPPAAPVEPEAPLPLLRFGPRKPAKRADRPRLDPVKLQRK